jgi:hypothetical protein
VAASVSSCTIERSAVNSKLIERSGMASSSSWSLELPPSAGPSHVPLGNVRNLPSLLGPELDDRIPDAPTVPALVALLRSTDESERDEALATLAEMVDGAFGEDGAQLGEEMRANGGVALLSWLLADPNPEVQQMSLMILGNLCSDSVDSNSAATKHTLLRSGGARAILSCVHTEDPAVLLFACGALQNLCYEADWSELAVSYDVHLRLESLLTHEDGMIVRYASGALQNITRALNLDLDGMAAMAVKERSLEHRREEFVQQRALSQIAKAVSSIPTEVRQKRAESARRRRGRAANSDGSRPSSAASSRSTSSFVSARSSMTSGSSTTFPAGAPAGVSPHIGRVPSYGTSMADSPHGPVPGGPRRQEWPVSPPVSPLVAGPGLNRTI